MKHTFWLFVLFMMVLSGPAYSADGSVEARARKYHRDATTDFEAGRYVEAQAEFAAGYELSRKPGFLWNMAECARLLNRPERALELYEQYLKDAPQTAPQRQVAAQRVKDLEPAPVVSPVHAATVSVPAPSAPSAIPSAKVSAVPLVLTPAYSAPASNVSWNTPAPLEASKPITKRWWFWTAAAGVVVASVISVAIVANGGSSPSSAPSGTYSADWKR